jgi:sarcosine oxidase / L-pipecolate oxidase
MLTIILTPPPAYRDSITPSQNQLLTPHPHPALPNLFLAVGGSFHSYKFLPNIGAYMASVVREGTDSLPEEHRKMWAWKDISKDNVGRGAHEKVVPRRDLKDLM